MDALEISIKEIGNAKISSAAQPPFLFLTSYLPISLPLPKKLLSI
jgi:hypothetical protein